MSYRVGKESKQGQLQDSQRHMQMSRFEFSVQLPGLSLRCQLQRAVDGTAEHPAHQAEMDAAQVAEEVFTLARVVRTFGTERREGERYQSWLKRLTHLSVRQATAYLMCRPHPPPCLRFCPPARFP